MKYLKTGVNRVEESPRSMMWLYRLAVALRPVFICYAVHVSIVYAAVMLLAESQIAPPGGFINPAIATDNLLVERLLRWDAHWYTYIAEHGYTQQSIVFFPMIVLLIRLMAPLLSYDYALAGFVICNLFAFLSFIILYYLIRLDATEETAYRALLAYAVFPTSFFLNSVYTESIFLSFALAALYLWRKEKWLAAGICAGCAVLTRNIGIFIVPIMLWDLWQRRHSLRHMIPPASCLLIPPLAFAGFIAYNARLTGDYFAFVHSQKAWGREFSLPWDNIVSCAVRIYNAWPLSEPNLVLDLILVAVCLAALGLMTLSRSAAIPRSYLALGWIWLIIPLCSSATWLPLYSMSRFTLVIFPLYFGIARLPAPIYRLLLVLSAAGLAWYTLHFAAWRWVS